MPNKKNIVVRKNARAQRRKDKKQKGLVPLGIDAKARQVGETVKQLENDVRFSDKRVNTTEANQLANQLKETIYEQIVASSIFLGPVIAYVSYALQKGYMANATSENYPYYATCYITQMIVNAVQNGVPLTTDAPYWLVCLLQAVAAKSVPFANGKAAYRFKLDNPAYIPPSSVVISPAGTSWWVWEPSATNFIDGFPVGNDTSSNPTYTTELGQAAWTSITEFMASSSTLLGGTKENKMVPLSTKTPFLKDVSSFGVNNIQCGVGYGGAGAALTNVQLEVPVIHPQFAVFNGLSVLNPGDFRYPNYVTASAGDAVFLGGFLSSLLSCQNYGMKRAPKFHFVDMNEFVDVIAWWYTGMLQTFLQSPTFLTALENTAAFNFAIYQCPLTFQEFVLLVRNVVMGVFKDTQPATQSIHPHPFQTEIDQQFAPLSCGSNTCFLSDAGGMVLPLPLIENLRALTFRYLFHKGTLKNPKDIEMWIPVVGVYNNFTMDSSPYIVTLTKPDGTEQTYPVFAAESKMVKRTQMRSSKGVSVKEEKLAEPIINIIDGTAYVNGQTVPIFINDPNRLSTLITLHNVWLRTYLLTYSCGTGIFSTDAGPSSLCAINMTRYMYGFNNDTMAANGTDKHIQKKDPDVEIVDLRLEKRGTLGKVLANSYNTIGYATTSATNTIMSAPYSGVLDVWILPGVNSQVSTGSTQYDTPFQRWASGMREVYATIDSSGNTILILVTKHQIYAAKMFGPITMPLDDWMIVITKFLESGKGGILTSTIASMIPGTAGAICSAIAGLLPI